MGTNHFIENTRWPKVRPDTHISDPENLINANGGGCDNVEPTCVDLPVLRSKSPPWEEALCMIPVLTDAFLENLLQRRSMSFVIRSIARVLMTSLPTNVLKKFRMSEDSILNQKREEKESQNKRVIKSSEISDAFRKLAFMTVIKASNAH